MDTDLASILSDWVSLLREDGKEIVETPRIGIFSMFSPCAELVQDVLRALCDKIVHEVRLRWAYRSDASSLWLSIDVIGVEAAMFDDSTSLDALRTRTEEQRGDLTVWRTTEGTMVRLELKLF